MMPAMRIILDSEEEEILKGINRNRIITIQTPITIAGLPAGMVSGKPSVNFTFELPNGEVVFAETSMRMFQLAAKMFIAKYGEIE